MTQTEVCQAIVDKLGAFLFWLQS